VHPIIPSVARKRRSAFWRRRQRFRVLSPDSCGAGVRSRLYSFQALRWGWGALKDKIQAGGFGPPACFGTSCASGVNGVVCQRGEAIDEDGADEEAAEKRLHVLATSLEALSAIRRCCQNMEVLFSHFHVGDMGMGVVGGRRGHRFGRLVVSGMCGGVGSWCLLPELRNKKKSCKHQFTRRGRRHRGGGSLSQSSAWPVGCVVDVRGWCGW
jgi:hypothetical protein